MERLKTLTILALLAAMAGGIALAATDGEAEVRITARQLEDGRVEFALQQRVGGEWGERILPRGRYFPTGATVGRWLNSTPLTVTAAESEAPAPSGSYTPQTVPDGNNEDGSLVWGSGDSVDGFRSFLVVRGSTNDGTFDEAVAYFVCDHDDPNARVYVRVHTFYAYAYTGTTWHTSFDSDRAGSWRIGSTYNADARTGSTAWISDSFVVIKGEDLLRAAMDGRWFSVTIPTYYDDWDTASFDLDGSWSTPVQRNLENCGR